jgi:hypothetical protein
MELHGMCGQRNSLKVSASEVIDSLQMYVRMQKPFELITDNYSVFISSEMKSSVAKNNIKHHIVIVNRHKTNNAIAERAVLTVKQGLAKGCCDKLSEIQS